MRYVYFTKLLRELDVKGLISFCQEVGLDGVDLAVRPGYPVNPGNVGTALAEASRAFKDAGLMIGLVTASTDLTDPEGKAAGELFDACGKAGVAAVKVGYFSYRAPFDDRLREGRARMAGFARLAAKTRVKACYHTHSGNMLGNNGAGLRLLLQDLDPHHVGAFLDTGHTALNGGPIGMEVDLVRSWLSLVAIKDMSWEKGVGGWRSQVVPVGSGIVRWSEVARALEGARFTGTVSLHGEYEAGDLADRKRLARAELTMLKKHLG